MASIYGEVYARELRDRLGPVAAFKTAAADPAILAEIAERLRALGHPHRPA